jgi:hypothetical protein
MILKRIADDKDIEEMEEEWRRLNRHKIRKDFVSLKEKNILREQKAGIKKNYVEVTSLVHRSPPHESNYEYVNFIEQSHLPLTMDARNNTKITHRDYKNDKSLTHRAQHTSYD